MRTAGGGISARGPSRGCTVSVFSCLKPTWFAGEWNAYLPEILYDRVEFGVASVVGMLLPVLDVDVGDTADQKLEFTLVEDVN